MKKVLFCLSLIIGILVLNTVPSFAMDFPVSPDIIGGLGDLGYGLLGGATFDFNDSIYAVDDWDNLTQELKDVELDAKAKLFLGDYCVRRGIPFEDINPDLPTDAKTFYKSQYFSSNVRTSWNSYKLANSLEAQEEALRFPISPQAFSDWTGYSNFWYKKYIDQLSASEDSVIPNLPNEYSWLNTIQDVYTFDEHNGNNYNFFDFSYFYTSGTYLTVQYPIGLDKHSISYIFNGNDNDDLHTADNDQLYYFFSVSTPITIYIDSTPSGVAVNYSNINLYTLSEYMDNSRFGSGYVGRFNTDLGNPWFVTSSNTYIAYNQATFSSLDLALDYIYSHYANVNIYVDGDAWVIGIDDAPAGTIIPDFNDIIGGNDEDPLPAYDVILPDTTDNYGTFDITSIFDLIRQKIADASDSDPTTDGVLTGEDVSDSFKDRTGEAVDEEDVPIDDILDDSFPYEDTDNYPNLPPIPQIPLDNAFQGTTILSELIDASQQILPEPLTLAFWGMVFILFIIGLIRILHK